MITTDLHIDDVSNSFWTDLFNGNTLTDATELVAGVQGTVGGVQNATSGLGSVFNDIKNFLDCWGSSSTPQEAQDWIVNSLVPYYQTQANGISLTANESEFNTKFTKLSKELASIVAHQNFHKTESNKSCGRKGNEIKSAAASNLIHQLLQISQTLKDKFDIVVTEETINAVTFFPKNQGISENWKGKSNMPISAHVFNFKLKSGFDFEDAFDNDSSTNNSSNMNLAGGWFFGIIILGLFLGGFFKKGFKSNKLY